MCTARPCTKFSTCTYAYFRNLVPPLTRHRRGPLYDLRETGRPGWLAGAGQLDPSLTRFSDVKTFDKKFQNKAGTEVAGLRYYRGWY